MESGYMNKSTCTIDGCDKGGRIVKGMCMTHYERMRRRGTVIVASRFQDLGERFWSKVTKTDTCWVWSGTQNASGYGVFSVGGRQGRRYLAHRWAWMQLIGDISDDTQLDHRCHNPSCIRPEHLRPVTNKENHEHFKGAFSTSKTGIRGVSWDKSRKLWKATVTHNYKQHLVGRYESIEDAEAAVKAKRLELFTHNDADRAA